MRRLATVVALAFVAYAPLASALDQTAPAAVPGGHLRTRQIAHGATFPRGHLGFSSYTARFTRFDAQLDFDPSRLAASHVGVTVDPRSIQADNVPSSFLEMLASKDWLNAADFPAMTFRSKNIEVNGRESFRLHGDLTLHGVTKPIVLDASYNGGYASHPFEPRARIGFSARGSFSVRTSV